MRSLYLALLVCLTGMSGFGVSWSGERASAPAQTRCPISGAPVDGSAYADVDGFRVYTAGEREADEVRKNPGKAFSALAKNREAAIPVVWKCPSMRNPVDSSYPFIQQSGKRIYYCCRPCAPRIKKDFKGAASVMKKMAEEEGRG